MADFDDVKEEVKNKADIAKNKMEKWQEEARESTDDDRSDYPSDDDDV